MILFNHKFTQGVIRSLPIILVFCSAIFLLFTQGCTGNNGEQNTIVYAEVIGDYHGKCAWYDSNKEPSIFDEKIGNLSLYAIDTKSAGLSSDCDIFDHLIIYLDDASSSKTTFSNNKNDTLSYKLTYWAINDSISIRSTNKNNPSKYFFFSGTRK